MTVSGLLCLKTKNELAYQIKKTSDIIEILGCFFKCYKLGKTALYKV